MNAKAEVGQANVETFMTRLKADWRQYVIYAGFVVIFIFFSITLNDKGFLDPNNLLNIVRQTAMIAIMAVGMTFVLSAGEIDLSVGSVAGLTSVTTALAISNFGLIGGVFGGLLTGIVLGMVNGLLTTRVGIPSFLVTLAMMGISRGTAMWVSNTAAIPILDKTYYFTFGSGNIGPVPVLLIWALIAAVIGHIVLRKTSFGRKILATGGSETAARFTGIKTRDIKMQVLIISSLTAAFAGMLYAGRLRSGRFQLGEGDELSVIAAAVLGGTSLFGGFGSVVGSIMGALMIGLINNGLILMGLEFSQQLIARGVIILLAVTVARSRK
jgi:ribose transport system permease protein